ncbi:transcription antitermination protein NusB [Campylobacter sputorum subsp. bubulus]|uniref:Transcription antitermination protein NusB n=1 Tax=Campylobacter sputorum subsp. sputorum TaxID=32024 RepID=A0A381DK58_9BACT|nr:transcription antitermination factor NusB [Campylobacter sputorum]ASM34330.1 transcription antitermination protein [Campylobacter sputorum aubsp. sputorum RM3237]KAB0582276.1 transcription antitermination factor NusB [Campylobacter sputorum subsp. sputorum]QEL04521.1 transcription antitermination protein [Campylobacter sputorum subsp. sputorum]SUX09297.1 transcription antitermination protein NusB [Campylobacter sputorum subsp. bubulus]SUX10990.1 transcription antitermination protein NusB [C
MATRHQVRQAVVSLLYAKEMGSEMEEFSKEFLEEKKIRNDQKKFTQSLFFGINENLDEIDKKLDNLLKQRDISQIGIVERSILRLGAYEILFTDTDNAVIINEAIELAKELGNDSAPKFVNAVLDGIKK